MSLRVLPAATPSRPKTDTIRPLRDYDVIQSLQCFEEERLTHGVVAYTKSDVIKHLLELKPLQVRSMRRCHNLENLRESDAKRAGAIFRDIRDPCLLADGYHWLVVGTGDALSSVIDAHTQLRSVFSLTLALDPLKPSELLRLLERRYQALALDASKPVRAPVLPRAVQALYTLFHGDLRGTLAALDEAAHGLVGYGRKPDASLTLADIQPLLRHRYEADARARLTGNQFKALEKLAHTVPGTFMVREAASIWKNERSRASRVVAELQKAGYVIPLERVAGEERGRPATAYALSGSAKLAFPEYSD